MDALEMSLLYDYYGGLLTGKQRQCFDLRYNQDLSLGEIAQAMGVSRQAVSDNLTRTEALLRKNPADRLCRPGSQEPECAADDSGRGGTPENVPG